MVVLDGELITAYLDSLVFGFIQGNIIGDLNFVVTGQVSNQIGLRGMAAA
jgi:hypothetical protein